jgi:hypothetical protein
MSDEPIRIEPVREVAKGLIIVFGGMACVVIGAYGGMMLFELLMTVFP